MTVLVILFFYTELNKARKTGFGKTVLYPCLKNSGSNDCGFSICRIIDMKGMKL